MSTMRNHEESVFTEDRDNSSQFKAIGYQSRPKSFVYPSTPFNPNQILMTLNTEMVKEVIDLIKDTCCDENGNEIVDGNNQELLSFAGKLQTNMDFSEFHRERKRRLALH